MSWTTLIISAQQQGLLEKPLYVLCIPPAVTSAACAKTHPTVEQVVIVRMDSNFRWNDNATRLTSIYR